MTEAEKGKSVGEVDEIVEKRRRRWKRLVEIGRE
jgi:hypothetical protein